MTTPLTFDDFIAALPPERQQPMRLVWEAARAAMPPATYLPRVQALRAAPHQKS